jgi:hypothetical protein
MGSPEDESLALASVPYVRSEEKQMCLDRGPVLIDGREGCANSVTLTL